MMLPEKQNNYLLARNQGFRQVGRQNPALLKSLGACTVANDCYELSLLDTVLHVDLSDESILIINTPERQKLPLAWQILVLHYLASSSPAWGPPERWLSFPDFPDARGYEQVYRVRVLERLCRSFGRSARTFIDACEQVDAVRVSLADIAFQFPVFPRLSVIIAWYDGDDEFPPAASFLFPNNIHSFLSSEDVVVLSEQLIGCLQGKGLGNHRRAHGKETQPRLRAL